MILDLAGLKTLEKQSWLQHAIAPRPIGLVSTIDNDGHANLAPFSFFNLVSANPPIVIFSPARRARDNTTKHTFENLYQVSEAVVNIVTYEMVHQVSLASCDYPKHTDEFLKAGFTKEPATLVRPFLVKESPVKFECRIIEKKPLGREGGAGNLVIAEALVMHVDESILNSQGTMIDQTKVHHVARLGGDSYCSVNQSNLFRLPKPGGRPGIGVDQLPTSIRTSRILSPNNLAQLAGVAAIPEIDQDSLPEIELSHISAKQLLDKGRVDLAWQVILHSGLYGHSQQEGSHS